MIQSKPGQRLLGMFLFVAGGGFTAYSWHLLLTEGTYHRRAAALFPIFAVIGLGLLLFPIDMEQVRARHGVDQPRKFAHYPLVWKVLCFVALAAGFGNRVVMANW